MQSDRDTDAVESPAWTGSFGVLGVAALIVGVGVIAWGLLAAIAAMFLVDEATSDLTDPPFTIAREPASTMFVEVQNPICSSAGGGGVHLRSDRANMPSVELFDLDGECFSGEAEFTESGRRLRLVVWCNEQMFAVDPATLAVEVIDASTITDDDCGVLP